MPLAKKWSHHAGERHRAQHPATARVVAGHRASIRRAPGTATVPYLTGPDPFAGPGPGDRCPAQGPTRVSKPRDGSGYKLRASKDCRQGRAGRFMSRNPCSRFDSDDRLPRRLAVVALVN
jgi:hypothetical protein